MLLHLLLIHNYLFNSLLCSSRLCRLEHRRYLLQLLPGHKLQICLLIFILERVPSSFLEALNESHLGLELSYRGSQ